MKRELGLEVLKNNGVYLLYLCSLLLWVSTSKLGPIFISSVEIAALLFVILFLPFLIFLVYRLRNINKLTEKLIYSYLSSILLIIFPGLLILLLILFSVWYVGIFILST